MEPKIIAIFNQKGGVGKSTTSTNLAVCLAALGYRTLFIDLDAQGNGTRNLSIINTPVIGTYEFLSQKATLDAAAVPTPYENLHLIGATADLVSLDAEIAQSQNQAVSVRELISSRKSEIDYVIIDCPPSFGLTTLNALANADRVILPTPPEAFAYDGLRRSVLTLNNLRDERTDFSQVAMVLLTMMQLENGKEPPIAQMIRAEFHDAVLAQSICFDPTTSTAASHDLPVCVLNPQASISKDYRQISKFLVMSFMDQPIDKAESKRLDKEMLSALNGWKRQSKQAGFLDDLPGFSSDYIDTSEPEEQPAPLPAAETFMEPIKRPKLPRDPFSAPQNGLSIPLVILIGISALITGFALGLIVAGNL